MHNPTTATAKAFSPAATVRPANVPSSATTAANASPIRVVPDDVSSPSRWKTPSSD